MNKKRKTKLLPLLSGRIARVGLSLLFAFVTVSAVQAQTGDGSAARGTGDYNQELRTRTWSIYAEGGLSWATDVWYPNVDAKKSYELAPAVGGGVDFTIRPWVRVGAEYLWSRYRREQRFATLDTQTMPVKMYGNYLMNFHNAKLSVGFNLMELWPRRGAQWLNIWASTGVGYSFAKGNEYGMYVNNTITENGQTKPVTDGVTINNDDAVTITGNVRTTNRHEGFNKFYIPASLHIETDVSRQFTIGLKGEMDWLLQREDIAPKNLILALATVRYNFVPSRAKVLKQYYDGEIATLNDGINALQRENETERKRAETDRAKMQQEKADLQRRLADCESKPATVVQEVKLSHYVQFDHNSSYFSREEGDRLKTFAQSVRGKKLTIVAEASTPGADDYNQTLSKRRLARVVEALVAEGIAKGDLVSKIAIGEQRGKPASEGRRVTITVE
jgi:outer membrane protein OmpA-like peptidoglycan-associated protein